MYSTKRLLLFCIVLVTIFNEHVQGLNTQINVSFCDSENQFRFEQFDAMSIDSREQVEIAVNPQGDVVAIATRGTVRLYTLPSLELVRVLLQGEFTLTWDAVGLSWSSDGMFLAIGTYIWVAEGVDTESAVSIWNATEEEIITTITDIAPLQIAWLEDSTLLAVLEPVGEISVWDIKNREIKTQYNAYEDQNVIPHQMMAVQFGSIIALLGDSLILWQLDNNAIARVDVYVDSASQGQMDWNREDNLLAIYTSRLGEILTVDLDNRETAMLTALSDYVYDIAWSPDNTYLAVGTPFGIDLINQEGEERLKNNQIELEFTRVEWISDNSTIVSVSRAGTVFVLDIDQQCLLATLDFDHIFSNEAHH